jgi:hypothetical protein
MMDVVSCVSGGRGGVLRTSSSIAGHQRATLRQTCANGADRALDSIVGRNPALRRSPVAALECLRRFVGVRARHVLTDAAPDRSTRRVVGLADPLRADEDFDVEATIMLIDALLSTGREKFGFLQRYYLQPMPYVRSSYGLREASTAVVVGRSALPFIGHLIKKSPRMIRAASRSPRRPTLKGDFDRDV